MRWARLARPSKHVPRWLGRAAGIHLEGPIFRPKTVPAELIRRQHCRPPDWQEFERLQDAARGHIRLITLSPEYPSAVDFTRRAVASRCDRVHRAHRRQLAQIADVVNAGATMSTHLGNGAHAYVRRHLNYIWDQLSHDQLTACLIVDGFHLPPAVVKAMVRAKTPERVVLVSDVAGFAGALDTKPGFDQEPGLGAVEVLEDGRVVVAGQRDYLAGATMPLTIGIENVMRFAGVDLATAIDMCSARPARILKLAAGTLERGAVADLIQFEWTSEGRMQVLATYHAGVCAWRK